MCAYDHVASIVILQKRRDNNQWRKDWGGWELEVEGR